MSAVHNSADSIIDKQHDIYNYAFERILGVLIEDYPHDRNAAVIQTTNILKHVFISWE